MYRAKYYSGHKPGEKNKLEAEYEERLKDQKEKGFIKEYFFEKMKLKIGTKISWYTPDFMVITHEDIIEFHEVKGYWLDDAKKAIKAAALLYPGFTFKAFSKQKKKDGGGWKIELF